MTTRTSWSSWDDFFEDVFGSRYMVWHDGLDTSSLRALGGEARANAALMLRDGLAQGDPVAAQAIRDVGGAEWVRLLEEQLARATGSNRVQLAVTLFEITKDPRWSAPVIEVLGAGFHWSVGIEAAIALRRFEGPAVVEALFRAVLSDDYLVRYHACESLLALHRVAPASLSAHGEIFQNICGPQEGPPSAADRARFAAAGRQLRALFQG